jgi:hypothetical protein
MEILPCSFAPLIKPVLGRFVISPMWFWHEHNPRKFNLFNWYNFGEPFVTTQGYHPKQVKTGIHIMMARRDINQSRVSVTPIIIINYFRKALTFSGDQKLEQHA